MGIKVSKEASAEIDALMNEFGFEIWNAGCTHRVISNYAIDGFGVCESHNPLNPIKVYKTLQGALNFISKQDL